MNYIIIGLLVILIILVIVLIVKQSSEKMNESNITERLGKLESNTIKELGDFKSDLNRNINEDFKSLNENIEAKLRLINDRVNERIDVNFEKTNKTFTSVLERLSKIDEAQKKIDNLSTDIVSLQSVLTDKKTRGIFGEINLNHIMKSVFGVNDDIYKMQYTFPNATMVDCALFAPDPIGIIGIDSKFPLENYQAMVDKKNTEAKRAEAEKAFKSDVKKHIDAIASKYIIPNVTTGQAIMFLPAEAIFAEINAYHADLIEYAYKNKVWITSPTTLISTLTTLQILIKNVERDKHAIIIQKELALLGDEFRRYKDRWDKLYRSIDAVSKEVKEIHTTSDKITKRFNSINQVEIDKNGKLIDLDE